MELEFQEKRRSGIGGSDWGQTTELGDRCTRALVLDKRGITPDYPVDVEKQGYFDRGHALEPIICDVAEEKLNIKLRAPGPPPKSSLPVWWHGNPDRRIVGGGIFEAKSKGPWPFKKLVAEGPVVGEFLQCQHYLARFNQNTCVHFSLEPVTWATKDFDFELDGSLIDDMIVLGERIWKMVEHGPLPARLDASSKHCQSCPWRWSCQGEALYAAAELDQASEDVIEIEEGDLLDIQAEILEVKELKKELSYRESELNDRAKKIIGSPARLLVAGRGVQWVQFNRSSFDTARFKKEQPELSKKYLKSSVVNQMRWY